MECNRDEAIRAKELAEKKMQNNDFEGARKIAHKARKLFPELENISQLLAVCDVHCSAESRIYWPEKDLYGILQVDRVADEATIRKQYRKLALVLHPDKNKYPGAESAFKLIGEANMILSDKGKRYIHDIKCRDSARLSAQKQPHHQGNQNSSNRPLHAAQNKMTIPSNSQFSSSSHHQSTQSGTTNVRESFWTSCPFCSIRYQYYRDFVNRPLKCQNCLKPFVAYEIGTQGAPMANHTGWAGAQGTNPASNRGPPTSQQKEIPKQGSFKAGTQRTGPTGGFSSFHSGSQTKATAAGTEPTERTESTEAGLDLKTNLKQNGRVNMAVPKQSLFKAGTQSTDPTGGFSSFHSGSQSKATAAASEPERTESTEAGLDLKTKLKQNGRVNMEVGKKGAAMPKVEASKSKEAGTSGNKNRKRRKLVVESSQSCDTASDTNMEEVVFEGTGGKVAAGVGQDSGVVSGHCPRRSSRQRQQVSYNENANVTDDISSPPKRSRVTKSSGDSNEEQKEEISSDEQFKFVNSAEVPVAAAADQISKQEGSAHTEGRAPYVNSENGRDKVGEAEAVTVNDHSKANADADGDSEPEFFECPDPEFSDFDKDKEEHCFAVDQIWACYDTIDGMPRFYAQVRKVYSHGFKLRITWLEADPEDQGEIEWADEGLPVGCGIFKRGKSEDTSDRLTFSHQILFEKGRGRCSYVIYPRKGETWALFSGWDIKWSSDPENHMNYKYEIVEVLSDYVKDTGVHVTYLEKIRGFVSLFQKTSRTESIAFLIPSNELFRFSHRIPSFKMSGAERQGVPGGSFELDPASLPTNPDDVYCLDEVKTETERTDTKANGKCAKSFEEELKPKMCSEKMSTPRKIVDSGGKNDINREAFILRRSPRESNKFDKNGNHVHAGLRSTQEGTLKHLNGSKDRSPCVTPSKGTTSQVIEETCKPISSSPRNFSKSPGSYSSLPSGGKRSEEVFHDFNAEKSESRFEQGQIWALYKGEGEMPRHYAQIKKIESNPYRLHVTLLEVCTMPKYACCGIFKVGNGKSKLYQPSSFSHHVKAECNGKNRFNIYPRKQEIWAVYKNWNAESSFSDLERGEYEVVEVLESSMQCIKVSSLSPLNGYKSVFMSLRRQRSTAGMEIPLAELARFSHQIPAYRLTGEKDGRLRGCWELDPASVPVSIHEVKKG